MSEKLISVYSFIDKNNPFVFNGNCEKCSFLCNRNQSYHWLLQSEAHSLIKYFDVQQIFETYFFQGGECKLLKNKKCSVYEKRPLECRLSPISIMEIENKPYFVLDSNCLMVQNKMSDDVFQKTTAEFIIQLTGLLDTEMINELTKIAHSIALFDKEQLLTKQIYVLRKLTMPSS